MIIEKQIGSEMLSYNPNTGEFRKYCKRPNKHISRIGWYIVRGCTAHGYPHVSIDGKKRLCHRLAFEIMGIKIPEGYQVDHIYGDKMDLRFDKLRIVTPSQNQLGHRHARTEPLPRNVTKVGRRYRVTLTIMGRHFRPYFSTIRECVDYVATQKQILEKISEA